MFGKPVLKLVSAIKFLSYRRAGKESSKERMDSSVLDKIPFLRGCEDDDEDDSDEEEDFQGMTTDCIDGRKNKKSRSKVRVFTWR